MKVNLDKFELIFKKENLETLLDDSGLQKAKHVDLTFLNKPSEGSLHIYFSQLLLLSEMPLF